MHLKHLKAHDLRWEKSYVTTVYIFNYVCMAFWFCDAIIDMCFLVSSQFIYKHVRIFAILSV